MKSVADHLQRAALALKEERPGMSVRAVAARLNVSPSYWSKILRGERSMSQQLLPRVVKFFGMDVQQVAELQKAILREIENSQLAPVTGLRTSEKQESPVATYRILGEPDFWLLEEWFHIAIMNAVTMFEDPSLEVIASRLGLDLELAKVSAEKLIAAGLLKNNTNVLERTDLKVRFPTGRSHKQVRHYHGVMIQKAKDEITNANAAEEYNRRHISSVCFAGSKQKIEAAKLILEEAIYNAANLMANDSGDEIFQLNVQLFPLTKPEVKP